MPAPADFADRCLPGDVEVLTDAGWRRGIDLRDGDRLATWDPLTGDVTVEAVDGVETGRYHGPVISLAGGVASTTGNPERGVWVRSPVTDDLETWTHWHLRSLADLGAVTTVRIPVAGHRSGPGLRGDAGDYAGVLGWISLEEGYHGTSVQIRSTGSNHHRVAATAGRLEALGARMKRVPGRNGTTAQAWFLPGPLTVGIRRDLSRGLAAWPSVLQMNSVELHAFVDGAVGGRRHSLHRLAPDTVDLLQAVGALTGHRTVAHDVGRRAGATVDMSIGPRRTGPPPRRPPPHRHVGRPGVHPVNSHRRRRRPPELARLRRRNLTWDIRVRARTSGAHRCRSQRCPIGHESPRRVGMLDRLDRRNRRLVHEQMERDPRRLVPAGAVAVVPVGALVWIAFWTAMALAGAGSSGWAALLAVVGIGVNIVLLRDVIADLRDLAARRRPRQSATSSPQRGRRRSPFTTRHVSGTAARRR